MLIRNEITSLQAAEAMRNGEFGPDVTGAGGYVAVIMSQGWCGQWHHLNSGLKKLEREEKPVGRTIHIFTLVYDEVPYFEKFLRFKEEVFANDVVPYIRYYRDGSLLDESNYISPEGFLDRFGS